MNFGGVIKKLRKDRGLKQKDFSDMIGVTQSYLSTIEHNKKKPTMRLVEKISDVLGLNIPILFIKAIDEKDIDADFKSSLKSEIDRINNLL